MKKIIVMATGNANKAKEIQAIFGEDFEIKTLKDYPELTSPEETGTTFRENALIKGEYLARTLNVMALADDSGLIVDALGGAPGVYSARFAGVDATDAMNNEKLLKELAGIEIDKRTARFMCSIALVLANGDVYYSDGVCEGVIGGNARGEGGFGYDPLFFLPEFNRTMAELTMEEKNLISHRGKAIGRILPIIRALEKI